MKPDFWELENRLWTQGSRAFEEMMDLRAIMILPGFRGIRNDGDVIDVVDRTGPWERCEMFDRMERFPGDVAILAYRVVAHRADGLVHRALCSSVWQATAGKTRLMMHQQTADPDLAQ